MGVSCRGFAIEEYESVHEAIKSRAEVMGDFSDIDTPTQVWLAAYSNAVHILPSLRIQLRLDELIIGLTPEGFLGACESLDFTFCTPYLEVRAIERMHKSLSMAKKRTAQKMPKAHEIPVPTRDEFMADLKKG